MTTHGWLRSRRTNCRRLRATYSSRFCSGRRPAVPSHLSNASSHTRMPISSQRSSTSGAGQLWLVRSAFAPMSFMICSWRRIADLSNAMPSSPRSEWRSTPLNCTRRPFRWNPFAAQSFVAGPSSGTGKAIVRMPKRTHSHERVCPPFTSLTSLAILLQVVSTKVSSPSFIS